LLNAEALDHFAPHFFGEMLPHLQLIQPARGPRHQRFRLCRAGFIWRDRAVVQHAFNHPIAPRLGGIRAAKSAIHYLVMVRETLGQEWLSPHLFRFGASTLANDLVRQVLRLETGRYMAGWDMTE
jgi:hypothetical protein